MKLRKILSLALAATMLMVGMTGCSSDDAASWPERDISLVVPFAAGGDTDYYGRILAKYLEDELGVSVVVVNTEGSGGTVGAQTVATSEADGYTILFYHTGNLYANKMLGVSDLDQNSFEIACIGIVDDTNTLVVPATLGINTFEEFVAAAQAAPGEYSCAVTISGFSYYTLCLLQDAVGFEANPVDAGGASAMIPALLGDQVSAGINSYGVFKQYVEDGSVVPLMTFGEQRSEYFPDVPTAIELGYESAVASRAYFFALPEGTDPEICQTLSDAVANIQNNEEYVQAIADAYCVTAQYYSYDDAMGKLDELWNQMEPYTAIMNQ